MHGVGVNSQHYESGLRCPQACFRHLKGNVFNQRYLKNS